MKADSLITEEARAMIGKEGETITREVHEKEIHRYCYAVGDLNPVYLDEEEAKKSKYGGIVAPPMFYDIPNMQEFSLDDLKEDGLPEAEFNLPIKAARTMAGGKEVEFFKPMRPGDIITRVGKIVDIYEKEGRNGPLAFTIFENRYTNQDGELVAVERMTGISF